MSTSEVKPALSVAVNQLLYEMKDQGRDIFSLSLGEAFFHLPFLGFEKLDWERGFHYSDSRGTQELREAIQHLYSSRYSTVVDSDTEVLVTAGSKIAIFMVLKALIDAGDVVSVFEPAWVSYREQILLAGGTPEFLPFEDSFQGSLKLHPKTSVVILNNPNNPSGRNYSAQELERIKFACDEVGATLMVDEAYSDFVSAAAFFSGRRLGEDVVVVNSLSKNLGMSGWRLGYLIARPQLVEQVLKLQQNLITCAPTLLQLYVAEYLETLLEQTKPQIQAVVSKRNETKKFLAAHGIRCLDGDSTFYLFADARSLGVFGNVTDFSIHALFNWGVAIVPGVAYGDRTENFVRISVGVEPMERIQEAVLRLIGATTSVPSRSQLIARQEQLNLQSKDWLQW